MFDADGYKLLWEPILHGDVEIIMLTHPAAQAACDMCVQG
jgi:hypothetical protein